MSYNTKDLQDESRFRLLKILRYEDIVEFVFENIRKPNYSTRFYYLILILLFACIVGFSVAGFRNDLFIFRQYFKFFLMGFVSGSVLIIPVHELLHGFAYKIAGAPRIDFGSDLRQGIFYVAANNYVIGRKKFAVVALMPFLVINIATLIISGFLTPYFFIMALFLLFFHNLMCIGDFAMLSFFLVNEDKELYTYDNHKEKTSYIYEKLEGV